MKILVTGATGLVGERLLPRLVGDGHDCRALVRRPGSVPDGVAEVVADLSDRTSLAPAVNGVEAIVHLAAVFRTTDTDLIWKTNRDGTSNLISAVQQHAPAARLIMASTADVYEADCGRPGREDDPAQPQQAYPASKLAAENSLRSSDLTWAIQRYGFVYGEGDGHLESLHAHAANAGMHPAQRMSLVHHRDIAAAIRIALTGAWDGRIVNIADDAPTTLYELVDIGGYAMDPSSKALERPWRLHMDGGLARRLGFQPTVRTIHQAADEHLL
ncbi:NAD(P)-dependent oxidoreductase [Mycolicibacterium sp. 3033]|nr:NAD(P)-dependent oxidoreductase [Mycolicibacterium aurantiacum]